MTELERLLTQTLTTMEQQLTTTQATHTKRLNGQQERLEAQARYIQQLRQTIATMQSQQQASAQHLQRLSELYTDLQGLLERLNGVLHEG